MMRGTVLVALSCMAALAARAESTGEIDWQSRTIKARGQGAPDLNAPSISAARLGAEKAAKADALRNLLETLQGVKLKSGESVGTLLQGDARLRGQVDGTLRGFQVIAPHYYADGAVSLEAQVPLDKLPPELLARLQSGPAHDPAADASTAPGPAALPSAQDEPGKTPAQAAQPPPLDEKRALLQARGQGLPGADAASVAVARLGAERAARLDALRVLLAALKSGSARAGRLLEQQPGLTNQVDAALRGYRVTAVHYYADGGVALDVQLPVDQLPPDLRAALQAP